MPGCARREIVHEDEVGVYHCVARCVRRAFLCGDDPLTQQSFDHRKTWIRQRLEELAGIFAVDVGGFAVMSNHIHLVVRTRPDVVARWSDEEVALRWWRLFPHRRDEEGRPADPEPHELAMLRADPQVLAERRRRLGSLSWWMRCLCEPIARRANREDGCTGRFWEGRFKCQALLDEAAVLACSIYVDLNPIRAAVAQTPEQSEFTSGYERIHAERARRRARRQRPSRPKRRRRPKGASWDGWLSPIRAERPAQLASRAKPHADPAVGRASRRASSKSFLNLPLREYLRLLDWTGRQLRRGKRGSIRVSLAPILQRVAIDGESWLASVASFGRWFHRAVGHVDRLKEAAARAGRHWLQGVGPSQAVFA